MFPPQEIDSFSPDLEVPPLYTRPTSWEILRPVSGQSYFADIEAFFFQPFSFLEKYILKNIDYANKIPLVLKY